MVAYYKVDVMVGVEIQTSATMQMKHSMIFMMSAVIKWRKMHEKQNPKSRLVVDTCWSSLCACSDDFVEVYEMTDPCDNCKRPWCYDCPYQENEDETKRKQEA